MLLAHRLCDAQLHEALGQERSRFNRYLSDVIYPAVGGPPLVDIVHHLRALEQDHASRREKRRGRSGQHSRSA